MSTKSILSSVVLSLQFCLAFLQIGKLTWVFTRCGIASLLPLGLSADYARLKHFEGRVYKTVSCHVTVAADQPTVRRQVRLNETQKRSSYLGVEFHLERRGENKLYLNGKMCYYITDTIWCALLDFADVAPNTVFLKGYKEFWQQVATGGVMTLSDVLDNVILENHTIKFIDNDLLLPVNLTISEEKLLVLLNLVGLLMQTRQVYWLIPILLSSTAALLEFGTSLRKSLYCNINLFFCRVMHIICDRLPRSIRRQVYSFGCWIENLKPSNDLQLRVVKGEIYAVIGGGAKVHKEGAALFEADDFEWSGFEGRAQIKKTISCGKIDADYRPIDIECWFYPEKAKCKIRATTVAVADVDCNRDEFAKLCTFLTCVAKNRSGSILSCDSNDKVRVRGFRDSVACYCKSGFPPVYELKLYNVTVE